MAKAQKKKAVAARGKATVKKAAGRVKSAVKAVRSKVTAKAAKNAKKPSPARKALKPAPKTGKAAKAVKAKPALKKKGPAKPKPAAKGRLAAKAPVRSPKKPLAAPKKAVAVKVVAKKTLPKGRTAAAPAPVKAAAAKVAPAKPKAPAPVVAAAPPSKPVAARPVVVGEKKRGRRPRPRVQSSGVPVAAWLSTEKPRPASFIPAPPRAEAPSAIAAPPASSDRLHRPDDQDHPAVRTVPVRIDVEQAAGRYDIIANPLEVTLGVGEGIEWDFRYIGGADVSAEEVIIEFDKPSPFPSTTFKARKPGGGRPHRQLSGAASAAAAGKRIQYRVRAMTGFKTELASTSIWMNVTR